MPELLTKLKYASSVTVLSAAHGFRMPQTSDRILRNEDGQIVRTARLEEIDFSAAEFE